jgi:hypothetical protein
MNVVLIVEPEDFLSHELFIFVGDDGVQHPKPVDDVAEEEYGLLGFDLGDRLHEMSLFGFGN